MKPEVIVEIEKYYNIELLHLIEDEREESKVEFYKNENAYSLNPKNEIQKLNLRHIDLNDLNGLSKIKNTVTHLNLDATGIENIDILSNFKNLIYLDLSSNNIEDINPIKNLKKLELLHLDNNKINKIPELKLPKLKEILLYSNSIEDITNLKYCLNLNSIYLSNNQIESINILGELKDLKTINLSKNKIFDIITLNNFKSLYLLDLSSNLVTNVSSLSNLDYINHLNLESNQIEDIAPLKFIEIKELFIGENKIFDLTPIYFSLKTKRIEFINTNHSPFLIYPTEKVAQRGEERIVEWFDMIIENCNLKIVEAKNNDHKSLDLGMMGLTDLNLIPKLFELSELEELILSNIWAEYNLETNEWEPDFSKNNFCVNNLINIPNEISNLKSLKRLVVGGDWKKNKQWTNRWRIKEINSINKLDNIEYLNISNNQIKDFKITRNLKHLRTIHVNNNKIKSISISRLLNLEYLFASNNLIENVIFLKKSNNLKAIDLHRNLISDLFPIKELIIKIGITDKSWLYDTISIENNPLKNPGIEVVQRGKDAVLRRMKSNYGIQKFINDELKLILVGNSETGKTTLAKYLNNDINYKEKHPFTLWMNVMKIDFNDIKLNVFDFGGHEYFHDTHHIFFTKNTLYFILWEEKTNKYLPRELNQIDSNGNSIKLQTIDYPIFYWLDSVKHFIKDSIPENFSNKLKNILEEKDSEVYNVTSLVIQNKVSGNNDLVFLNNRSIVDDYSFIHDLINIELHKERNLNVLNESLIEMIEKLGKITGGEYPIYYQKIKEKIEEFKSYNGKKYLTFNEFKRLCQAFKRNLTTDEEFLDIAYFLNDIGLILISKDKNTFYLDLYHLSNQIIKIYEGLEKNRGVLNENEIIEKNIDDFENVLKMITDFSMAFEITKNNLKNYVFPLFLPDKANKIVGLLLKDNIKTYKRIQYKGFMHKGIILHIFSEYSNKIVSEEIDNNTYYWKNGLIVKENDNLVLIKFFIGDDLKDAYIDLYNFGSTEIFVESIKERIIEINKTNNYDVKEHVSVDGVNFIPLELIHTNEENKNEAFLYDKDLKYYKLYDFKKFLKNKNSTMKKVFLSYSRQNLSYKESLKTHLSILERYGLLKAWSCDQIVAGKWNQQIQKELEESDIIIYMVSADFMSSNYIMEDEVKKGIELVKKNPDKKIICVLVGVCQWSNWSALEEVYNQSKDPQGSFSTSDLSQFQFLPYHQYKNEQGVAIREEIVALEKWGRHPYDVINEAYNQIVSRIFNEITN
jgi:internalin A